MSLVVWIRLVAADDKTFTAPVLLPLVAIGLAASVPGALGTHLYLRWRAGPDPRSNDAVPVRITDATWTSDTGDGALLVLHRHPNERAWVPQQQAAPQGFGTVSLSLDVADDRPALRLRTDHTQRAFG